MSESRAWFPAPALPEKLAIASVVPPIGGIEQSGGDSFTFSDKSLVELIERLREKGALRDIEWLIIFSRDEEFAQLSVAERSGAIKLIWSYILKDSKLVNMLLSKMMQGLERGYQSVAEPITSAMPSNVSVLKLNIDKQRFAWVRALNQQDLLTCARIGLAKHCTIRNYVEQLGYTKESSYIIDIYKLAAQVLPNAPSVKDLSWWLKCQAELTHEETVAQLEVLLPRVSYVEAGTRFDCWLQKRCLPEGKDTYWYALSSEAQLKLKSFYNVIDFKSVKYLFEKLSETSVDPNLIETHARNLLMRTNFWADYSDAFKRVRFLLTHRSERLLERECNLSQFRVTVMPYDTVNEQSEICIFDTGSYFLIERFRGTDFDLGIFEKTPALEAVLFGQELLDGHDIARLTPNWIHDHKDYWQKRLVKFLQRFGIVHNKGIRAWSSPIQTKEQDQVNTMLERRYSRVLDKSKYFKIGRNC
ncbi:hypothetical protein [Photobacterium kagoshimensis]|uniref:hypothetical protein n=1 Tax=Photobacterium kagoshimensis TaxID=2910242 RepID=UPI003D1131D3